MFTRPLRILLAEDNYINRVITIALLKKLGHTVDIAENGVVAVAAWKANPYDLILLDMNMPEMNGLEAARSIRQQELPGQRIPIIALTANMYAEDREKCLASGMNTMLTKPIFSVALGHAISEHCPSPKITDMEGDAGRNSPSRE